MSQSLTQEIENLNNAVYCFSEKMRNKLKIKARQGYKGWDDKTYEPELKKQLESHYNNLKEGDYSQAVDVANIVLMLDRMHNE